MKIIISVPKLRTRGPRPDQDMRGNALAFISAVRSLRVDEQEDLHCCKENLTGRFFEFHRKLKAKDPNAAKLR